MLQQQQNLGRRFGTSRINLSPQWFWLLSILRWGSVDVDSLLFVTRLWDSVIVLCFVVSYFVSIQILQSSRWKRESLLVLVRGDRDSRANLMPIYGDLYKIKL